MHAIEIITKVTFFSLLFICAFTDYKYGKIRNKYLFISLLIFFALYILKYVVAFISTSENVFTLHTSFANHIIGFLIGFAIGFLFYITGVFKGGDAKLLAIMGLYIGKDNILLHFSIIIIFAGIGAFLVMIKHKILINKFKRIILYFKGILLTGKFTKYATDPEDNIKFPFAVYMLLGEIASCIINYIRR